MKKYFILFFSFFILLNVNGVFAQQRGMKPVDIPLDGKTSRLYNQSYALIIGVSDYNNGWPQLPGVKNEMETVRKALENNGFLVETLFDPTKEQLDRRITDFIGKYGQGVDNRLLFYFAGHGYTVKTTYGEELGYIVPVDAPNPNYDLAGFQSQSMEMAQVEIYARRLQAKHALFVFDACFSGSLFTNTRAVPEIINYKTTLPVRQFITSGSADEMVPDKSIFAEQFIRALNGEADADKDSYVTGSELGEFLQSTVVNYTHNSQHPQYGKIRSPNLDKGDFVFPLSYSSYDSQNEEKNIEPVPLPSGREKDISKRANKQPNKHSGASESSVNEFIPMVYVEGGNFHFGEKNEKSTHHPVSVSGFYISRKEITQKQWRELVGFNPSMFSNCDDCPVEKVNWDDAQVFINALNEKTGMKFRLPTEAEWEYAAKGGNKTGNYKFAGSNVADKVGWNTDNSDKKTHPAGSKDPNELGIYDMSGNVMEWCSDWFEDGYYNKKQTLNPKGPETGDRRVIRGGSWKYNPKDLKVIFRMGIKPGARYSDVGFRVVREE